jgi:hypothetical protein
MIMGEYPRTKQALMVDFDPVLMVSPRPTATITQPCSHVLSGQSMDPNLVRRPALHIATQRFGRATYLSQCA